MGANSASLAAPPSFVKQDIRRAEVQKSRRHMCLTAVFGHDAAGAGSSTAFSAWAQPSSMNPELTSLLHLCMVSLLLARSRAAVTPPTPPGPKGSNGNGCAGCPAPQRGENFLAPFLYATLWNYPHKALMSATQLPQVFYCRAKFSRFGHWKIRLNRLHSPCCFRLPRLLLSCCRYACRILNTPVSRP